MSDDKNLTDDEEFMKLVLIIGFPPKRKTFLERPNHFISGEMTNSLVTFVYPRIVYILFWITLKKILRRQ
jgi:hypothetical protein